MKKKILIFLNKAVPYLMTVFAVFILFTSISCMLLYRDLESCSAVDCQHIVCSQIDKPFSETHSALVFIACLLLVFLSESTFDLAEFWFYLNKLDDYNKEHPYPEMQIDLPKSFKEYRKMRKYLDNHIFENGIAYAYADYLKEEKEKEKK